MRRHVVIFLKFTRAAQHPHPHLWEAVGNYLRLLEEMKLPQEQIARRLRETGAEAGHDSEGFSELLSRLSE